VADWVAQTASPIRQKSGMLHRIFAFLPDSRSFAAAKPRRARRSLASMERERPTDGADFRRAAVRA